MYVDSYQLPLSKLKKKEITYLEFLAEAGCISQFRKWCVGQSLIPDEDTAVLFFDMHGFEDSEVVKEFVEPIN